MSRSQFLGTSDWRKVSSLLNSYDVPTKIPDCIKLHKIKQQDDYMLIELGTLLTPNECNEIIENLSRKNFEEMSNKYDSQTRNNSRLVIIDDQLGRTLWRRLKFSNKLHKLIENTKPLGFNVQGEWKMNGINPAMRINKYKKGHFFAPHKDAQYAPNGDERSLFSLIIYLNDSYKQGETKFYFPKSKSKSDIKGLTVKEEIQAYGGLENGYECITVKPKQGYAVLFTHNLLHEAVSARTRNSIDRFVLRTDVIVKRMGKPLGFAVCSEERDDYLACLNFFRQAQQYELRESKKPSELLSIGDLYERSLSIRYCYPRLLEEKHHRTMSIDNENKPLIEQLPSEIWLNILKFLHEPDVENLVFAYPEFHILKISWQAQENRNFIDDSSKEKFIPTIQTQYGRHILFRFSDPVFFSQHIDQCCRVAAVNAFVLLGNSQDSTKYTIRYNQNTQEVCEIEMEKLLADVFYNRNCYGSLYRVEQQNKDKRQPNIDFNCSVDQTYMINRHHAQFIGHDLLPRFHLRIKSTLTDDWDMDDDDADEHTAEAKIRTYQRLSALHSTDEQLVDPSGDNDSDSYKRAARDDILGYREQLIRQADQEFGTSICRIISAENHTVDYICVCGMFPRYSDTDFVEWINVYNHLIFDFDTHQLEVKQLSNEESKKFDSFHIIQRCFKPLKKSDTEDISMSYYRVNIEKLAEKSQGFNHASCYCEFPAIEVDQFSFLDYTYLSHVYLAVFQHEDHVFVLTTYDGIAAF